MNVPIVSSAGTSFVLSQPTMSPHSHMAPPDAPSTSTGQQMAVSTPPHVASPHMASSPAPPPTATSIQFSQCPTSVATVMSQSPTVLQTMAAQGGTLQFQSQMPVLQQGTLSPAGYIQPLYQTTGGQQQMLLSPASSLALQQQLSQGQITVMAGPSHQAQNAQKLAQDNQGKAMLTTVGGGQGGNKGGQGMTSQAGTVTNMAGKMTMTTSNIMAGLAGHKGNPQAAGQIMTGVSPQAQFVTQAGSNGQTLLISPLNMLGAQGGMVGGMGGMLQAQSPQGQVGKGQGQQAQVTHKFLPAGQQKGAHNSSPLQITGLPPGTQYRHISPAGQQQLITGQVGVSQVNAVGQPVLGQAQTILGSLQTFNAFGSGLPWATGQLQGQPLLQSPILIRNQHDGSVYIQSAPTAQHAQQQQHQFQQQTATTVQVQQQQAQNTAGQLGGPAGVSAVQQMQAGVLPGTVMHAGPVPTLVQAQQQAPTQQNQSAQQSHSLGQTPPPGQAGGGQQIAAQAGVNPGAVPPPPASPSQTASPFQPVQHLSVQANGQLVTTVQTSMQATVASRVQRPITPQQTATNSGIKVSTGSRGVRGIAARPATGPNAAAGSGTATPPNSQPPTPGPPLTPTASMDSESTKIMSNIQSGSTLEDKKDIVTMDTGALKATGTVGNDSTISITPVNITENQPGGPVIGATAGLANPIGLTLKDAPSTTPVPPIATVQPLELVQQPITTVPVVTLPDVPDVPEGSSTSPAIGAPFPEEAGNVPDIIEQASEILTHIIEGYVIRESSEPFPVSRSALLSEMIRREQACAGSKERKRKLENTSNANKPTTATATSTAVSSATTTTTTTSTPPSVQVPTATPTSVPVGGSAAAANCLGLGIDQLGLNGANKAGPGEAGKESKDGKAQGEQGPDASAPETSGAAATAFTQPTAAASSVEASGTFNRSPAQWNVQDVYDFIKSVPGCAAYAEEFRTQEIDGEALMFLSAERHLMQQMNMKVGPAAKIYARLSQLCSEYGV